VTGVWIAVAVIAVLIGAIAAVRFMTGMPGRTHAGPLLPLTATERAVCDELRRHVERLAGAIGERHMWRLPALAAAADYVERAFLDLGYRVERRPFSARGETVANVQAELPGTDRAAEVVLVGAHYDTVRGSPGANDNGSGIAALIELARLLHAAPLARTIRFVGFANEESPFFMTRAMGSLVAARACRAAGERVVAMLSLETIGCYVDRPRSQHYPGPFALFYPTVGNFIAFVGNLRSRALVQRCVATFRRATSFPSEGAALPAYIPGVFWSDHWAFWHTGHRAVMVTDTAPFRYSEYHTARDLPDRLDYERMARVVAGVAEVVRDLAS
jgi:Zn-dependent M28 family amino/carboxypeptidase